VRRDVGTLLAGSAVEAESIHVQLIRHVGWLIESEGVDEAGEVVRLSTWMIDCLSEAWRSGDFLTLWKDRGI